MASTNKNTKVSDYIAEFLYSQGVTHVFEMIGGMTTRLVDSIYQQGKVSIICMHHEQSAAFAAESMARITGIPGVAMATSGPGAVNLLTGIGSCYYDSTPAVFITGQVNRNEQKNGMETRQLGFQETDIVEMAKPITKAAWCVQNAEDIPLLLSNAFKLAKQGRPGPVLIDIPMDIQKATIDVPKPMQVDPLEYNHSNNDIDDSTIKQMLEDLNAAKRPLVLVGNGIRIAKAVDLLERFLEKVNIPVVSSLMGIDALPTTNSLRIGMIGTYGNRWANKALGLSDFLLILGSRLDIRQTGSDTDAFKDSRKIYHIDCDMGEINNRIKGCNAICSDLRSFFYSVLKKMEDVAFVNRSKWIEEIAESKKRWPDIEELKKIKGINPNKFMHQLANKSDLSAAYVIDVGQHQMWAAQSIDLHPGQRFLTSGGMGAMGFALPAAIGTAFALNDRPIVMIAGDGGFQINIQELQTIVHHKLPIKMVIINNKCYGMVRQFQQSYFDQRYQSTCWGYSFPDFERIAAAYGIDSATISDPSKVQNALDNMWLDPDKPYLLQIIIDELTNVYPKIAFGHPFTEMEPYLD